jgi:hypothetical protein
MDARLVLDQLLSLASGRQRLAYSWGDRYHLCIRQAWATKEEDFDVHLVQARISG